MTSPATTYDLTLDSVSRPMSGHAGLFCCDWAIHSPTAQSGLHAVDLMAHTLELPEAGETEDWRRDAKAIVDRMLQSESMLERQVRLVQNAPDNPRGIPAHVFLNAGPAWIIGDEAQQDAFLLLNGEVLANMHTLWAFGHSGCAGIAALAEFDANAGATPYEDFQRRLFQRGQEAFVAKWAKISRHPRVRLMTGYSVHDGNGLMYDLKHFDHVTSR